MRLFTFQYKHDCDGENPVWYCYNSQEFSEQLREREIPELPMCRRKDREEIGNSRRVHVFLTGRFASDAAEFFKTQHIGLSTRVWPLESTELELDSTHECADSFVARNANWREREAQRFASGEYVALPWAGQIWFDSAHDRLGHFAHVSKRNKRKITYTENESAGLADRQCSPLNVGRYFTRFASEYGLSPERIAELSVEYSTVHGEDSDYEFGIAMDMDGILNCYNFGREYASRSSYSPNSCMAYDENRSFDGQHPVRAYAAGDLGCAYLIDNRGEEPRLTARAMVWPAEKRFGRMYGDYDRLHTYLKREGYSENADFDGAKLLAIPKNNRRGWYVMPYLDCDGQRISPVRDSDDNILHFVIDSDGDYEAGSTSGSIELRAICRCDSCGDRINGDNAYSLEDDDSQYCESCFHEIAWQCDRCGHYVPEDEPRNYPAHNVAWCESCMESHFVCGHDYRTHRRTAESSIVLESTSYGETIRMPVANRYAELYFFCALTESYYRTNEMAGYLANGQPVSFYAMETEIDESKLEGFETVAARQERLAMQAELDLARNNAANPESIVWTSDLPIPDTSAETVAAMNNVESLANDMSNSLGHDERVLMLRNVSRYRQLVESYRAAVAKAQETLAVYRAKYGIAPSEITLAAYHADNSAGLNSGEQPNRVTA
jgi:hypothetical protein